jgi:hypothetical protein
MFKIDYHEELSYDEDNAVNGRLGFQNFENTIIDIDYVESMDACIPTETILDTIPKLAEGIPFKEIPLLDHVVFLHRYWLMWIGVCDALYPEIFNQYLYQVHANKFHVCYISVRNYLMHRIADKIEDKPDSIAYLDYTEMYEYESRCKCEVLTDFYNTLNEIGKRGVYLPKGGIFE